MKISNSFLLACLLVFVGTFLSSCDKDDDTKSLMSLLDGIESDRYTSQDSLGDAYPKLYGEWKFDRSSGGFHGGGYGTDFNYLLLKPNAIFGIVRNDSLKTWGFIDTYVDNRGNQWVEFIKDQASVDTNFYLIQDPVKRVEFQEEALSLYSPCCDRYDLHFTEED